MSTTVIVVPCFNEAQRLPVNEFHQYIARNRHVRFVLVNDGSQDETLTVLRDLQTRHPDLIDVVDLPRNMGKAEAVRRGCLHALNSRPDFIGYWDADLAAPLDAIAQFQSVLRRRPEIHLVIGSRIGLLGHAVERKPIRNVLGKIFSLCAARVLGLWFHDTQCGHKLFRVSPRLRELFETPFHARWIFDVELLSRWIGKREKTCLQSASRSIYELPLDAWRDVAGSKLKPLDFLRAFGELATIAGIYWQATHQIREVSVSRVETPLLPFTISPVAGSASSLV